MSRVWEELNLYSNRDLLERAYDKKHHQELSQRKARQIIASLEQGKQYLHAANDVSSIAKPLLVYYGVLALSRSIILFSQTAKQEEQLSAAHGVETVGWAAELAGSLENIRQLRIRTSAGTYEELVIATGNIERHSPPAHSLLANTERISIPSTPFPLGTETTLGELLKRALELSFLYRTIFNESAECFKANIGGQHVQAGATEVTRLVVQVDDLEGSHSMKELLKLLNVADGQNGVQHNISHSAGVTSHVAKIVVSEPLEQAITLPPLVIGPPTKSAFAPGSYLIWPIKEQYYLSTLSRTFLLAYALGMLGRYFPSAWMSGLSMDKGTAAFPLLVKAVDHVQNIYPDAALREFRA